jgi:hypothetical protein
LDEGNERRSKFRKQRSVERMLIREERDNQN